MEPDGPFDLTVMEVERVDVIRSCSLTNRDGTEKGDKGDFGKHFGWVGEMDS